MNELDNRAKAKVAQLWTAAVLIDRGWILRISPHSSRLHSMKGDHKLILRTKACYSEQGVPFQGFRINDSDFVVFVDLRRGALSAQAWVVPTRLVFDELEEAYKRMGTVHLRNRTFYWQDGHLPHYGFERKFKPFLNAWESLDQMVAVNAVHGGRSQPHSDFASQC